VSEVVRCAYRKCRQVIPNPWRRGDRVQQYCSESHRVAEWREQHVARCPGCGRIIRIKVETDD
jgi:hypothetical protein